MAQQALKEIEKQTGYKGILLLGGLTPAENGDIDVHMYDYLYPFLFKLLTCEHNRRYSTGSAITTGLSFNASWKGFGECHETFTEWLQLCYGE